MRMTQSQAELFAAFSTISAKVFFGNRLLSCPTLSKAPNYGNVLRRFLLRSAPGRIRKRDAVRMIARYCFANFGHLGFLLLSALCLRLLGWKRPQDMLLDPHKKLLVIDTFAVLPKIEKDGVFTELYMPGLAGEAERRGHNVVHFYRLYGSRDPRVLWRTFRILRSGPSGITEAHLFSFSDWLLLFWHILVYPVALWRLVRSLGGRPAGSARSCIRDALIHTAGQCVLIGEARRLAARRLGLLLAQRPFSCASDGDSGGGSTQSTHIVSWYENQTVNKCLMRGLAEARRQSGRHIPVTGAQLFLWPAALLNNHPDDAEAALGLAPDRVLVNGSYYLPERTAQRYAVGPSLRYAALFADEGSGSTESTASPTSAIETEDHRQGGLRNGDDRNGDDGEANDGNASDRDTGIGDGVAGGGMPLLALLSYHPDEVKRVLGMLLPLANAGTEVIYKFHPATKSEQFIAWLPMVPIFAEGSLKQALDDIRQRGGAVLGSGSGSLAEAVVAGIPVLAVEDPIPGLGLNYLSEFGKGYLWEAVNDAQDVERALETLQRRMTAPDREEKVREFRNNLFTEPTSERICRDFQLG